MKKSLIALLVAAPLALSLSGCVVKVGGGDSDDGYSINSDYSDREYENRKKIATLEVNTALASVQSDFGIADFNEVYKKDNENIQVLYYRTHRVRKDGLTTKDECTALIFKDGLLISWGDKAYNQL